MRLKEIEARLAEIKEELNTRAAELTDEEITKLERNGMFVYESVPGTTVLDLEEKEDKMSFTVEGPQDAQITVEMEEDAEYKIVIDKEEAGQMKTNLGGKLSFSVELEQAEQVTVQIERI